MRLDTSTPEACRRSLSKLINQTASGKLDPKTSNACGYLINICLSALRLDDQEKRLCDLEKMLTELERQRNG